ncbi:hypothetical protein B0J18DRAFT_482181, partial [Chaetomium sp. MPI-SDFR-AT-0129]
QPLNPFLSALSKSPLLAQCSPPQHHILLVPTADVLLNTRDVDSGAPLVVAAGLTAAAAGGVTDEFLASHIIRLPVSPTSGGNGGKGVGQEGGQNLREMRGKPKIFGTVNGRSLVVKDHGIYTNKGFKSLAQATLLHDCIWYPDTLDPRSFLVYYISRPLVGSWEEIRITPALLPPTREGGPRSVAADGQEQSSQSQSQSNTQGASSSGSPKKKDVRTFHELLIHFPAIAKQMQGGLEKLFREFTQVFERPLPPPPSASEIPDPEPDGPIATALKRARSSSDVDRSSTSHDQGSVVEGSNSTSNTGSTFQDDDETIMRTAMETAVTAAIDLFQSVDRQQLSLLGATTDLTGPLVERLIERYIAENVHHMVFPRLATVRRPEDLELEAKIRQMEHIDISQLGVVVEGGSRAKREAVRRLERAVEEFRKMPHASCPQEMMEILLGTMKAATQLAGPVPPGPGSGSGSGSVEKPAPTAPTMTINADTLVSLLLYIVIKAQIKHLQARLSYMQGFVFVDDVESGEMGYALSTFEAVLSYLDRDSVGLRRASRRNRALWDAVGKGDMGGLRRIMEPDEYDHEGAGTGAGAVGDEDRGEVGQARSQSRRQSSGGWSFTHGVSRRSSSVTSSRGLVLGGPTESFSRGSGLGHVFPFQTAESHNNDDAERDFLLPPPKRIKKVAMDTRSMSSGSEISFRSMPLSSIGTISGLDEDDGDTSIARLAQTQDAFGESVPMMAVQHGQREVLQYLLSLRAWYPASVVFEDQNNEGTTLFSAAVQLGDETVINTVLDFLLDASPDNDRVIREYLAVQDTWGRSAAHYLFHAPFLIARLGRLLPWRQRDKNGQTPLFALCRSYDHPDYNTMVREALDAATRTQGDGQPLHVDDHVDGKGNTLLHIIHDAGLARFVLRKCDVDVNAVNEKRFTPLMLASKYGRLDMVRTLFGDVRVDIAARELRGLTAVELAKDDEVRNKIDDLVLDGRTTAVVRAYFVEDASVRFVLKSSALVDSQNLAVTTCRRSLADFERLAHLLQNESPASWLPSLSDLRSPIQIPSRPSRAVLRDLQQRMDGFLRVLLQHPTFGTHEMLWEFFLVPDLQLDVMAERSRLKAEAMLGRVHEEMEPVGELREVEQFVDHAREMVRGVHFSTRSVARRANALGNVSVDLHEALYLLTRTTSTLPFLPPTHTHALAIYTAALSPSSAAPITTFFTTFLTLYHNVEAVLSALSRPPQTISAIHAARRDAERNHSSLARTSRWPLGLGGAGGGAFSLPGLDETRARIQEERAEKVRRSEGEAGRLERELRWQQQTVAGELAGWREMHERMGRRAVRELARGMVVGERGRLEGMRRALRAVRGGGLRGSLYE